jgi:DNA repair protein RadC
MDNTILASVRSTDGSLVAVFVGPGDQVVLRVALNEGTTHVDELFLRHLVMLTADVGVPSVAFVISRRDGRPTRIDRLLWRELTRRLAASGTELLDVVVVGEESYWSATSGRVAALAQVA